MPKPLSHNLGTAINPHLYSGRGLKEKFFGNRTIGAKSGIQASIGYYRACWPQVVDWPWSEDEAGVSFDQSAVYGVRTRCIRNTDGGEDDFLVAVPRSLPAGYTRQGRCRILPVSSLESDLIGGSPLYGAGGGSVRWRGPNGLTPWPQALRWLPMNFNRKTLPHSLNTDLGSFWVTDGSVSLSTPGAANPPYSPIPPSSVTAPLHYYGGGIGQHVGFRGGKITFSYRGGGGPPYPWQGYARVKIGYSATPISAPSLPANIVFDTEWYKTDADYVGYISGYHTYSQQIVAITSMLPAPSTTLPYWYILWSVATCGGFSPGVVDNGAISDGVPGPLFSGFQLSPRTDIPLWFFSSTGNKCAPGGYVA